MPKIDIIEEIYEKVGFSKREITKIVESVFDIIKETLQHEDRSWSLGLGSSEQKIKEQGKVEIRRREATWRLGQEEF